MADGVGPISFSIKTPASDDELRANIAHALTLGLPEADSGGKALHLIANGPSAHSYFDEFTGWRRFAACHGRTLPDTMAVNGSLKLFEAHGEAPTYWIGCDPQAALADFLVDGPTATLYLAASKCHPAVFAALKDRDVRLWHVNDILIPGKRQVPCAVSVTLDALLLANRLGYRRIDVWGWDCCFANDGTHHAGPGELSPTPDIRYVEVGPDEGPTFTYRSNPTWGAEVEDAKGILPVLRWVGTDVAIHGGGMVAAIIQEYAA